MNAINQAFQKAKAQGNGALIGYIMAGDPKPKVTAKIADALIKGGVDILELGLPFLLIRLRMDQQFKLQAYVH